MTKLFSAAIISLIASLLGPIDAIAKDPIRTLEGIDPKISDEVNVSVEEPDNCISGTFFGTRADPDKSSGFDMRCSLTCSDGQVKHFSRWVLDELGGGIFTVFDNNGRELFTGHTNASYKKYNDATGVYDPKLTFEGLIDKYCKKELQQIFPTEATKPSQ